MANRTVKDAASVHGTNPQYLIEKIVRTRIYESKYWKEECFALTAALLVDKAMELRYIGGTFGGNIKVTPFLCLILKMLQIQPDNDIVIEFIKNSEFKYVRCLGALYLRLTRPSIECYNYLEPLLVDYRKIRVQTRTGEFVLSHIDEFIDQLLRDDKVCDIILPRLQKRELLEDMNELEPRVSALEDAFGDDVSSGSSEDENPQIEDDYRSPSPVRRRKEERRKDDRRDHSRKEENRSRDEHRRERDRKDRRERRSRSRSRSREKKKKNKKEKEDRSDKSKSSSFKKDSLDISEANALRASLGLPPLIE